ncbi:hypothetical protein D9V41_14315 [Aeromicrobium phragmitis]|uniref:Dimethylamine monooxygenase subunit DmmA-like C-terminal domain-containing protein n=2 Tax=Aeromicrobium phragmitis TaxID=2478914 RepID=A0A3L8PHN2_9ACTN|nr:hypothetical protein D9V41_14315 [Aeromicrobium phragmitis]
MVQLDSSGASDCERWLGELPSNALVEWVRARDVAEAERLVEETVGAVERRLLLAGPTEAVHGIRDRALAVGFAADDITIAASGTGLHVVHCAHCSADTESNARLGEISPCGGCGRRLVHRVHVSRRPDRFLGYDADVPHPG